MALAWACYLRFQTVFTKHSLYFLFVEHFQTDKDVGMLLLHSANPSVSHVVQVQTDAPRLEAKRMPFTHRELHRRSEILYLRHLRRMKVLNG